MHAMRHMLRVANVYSLEYNITFNPEKSKLMAFGGSNTIDELNLLFNNSNLVSVKRVTHLGNSIGPDVKDNGINDAICDLYKRVNIMLAQFGKTAPFVKYKLFKTYCVILYGSQLWDYSSHSVDLLYTAWRKCVRRIWSLHPRTHCLLLPLICDDSAIEVQLHQRFLNFYKTLSTSNNECLKRASKLVLGGSRSAASNSLTFICNKYKLNKWAALTCHTMFKIKADLEEIPDIQLAYAGAIREFTHMRHVMQRKSPNVNDITDILEYLCTS